LLIFCPTRAGAGFILFPTIGFRIITEAVRLAIHHDMNPASARLNRGERKLPARDCKRELSASNAAALRRPLLSAPCVPIEKTALAFARASCNLPPDSYRADTQAGRSSVELLFDDDLKPDNREPLEGSRVSNAIVL